MNWVRRFFKFQFLKMARNPGTPENIAGGFSIGVFWGSTIFLGFHTLLSIFCAIIFKKNKLSAFIGSFIFTAFLPFIYSSSYIYFAHIFNYSIKKIDFTNVEQISNLLVLGKGLMGLIIGSILWGILIGFISYWFLLYLIKIWRIERQKLIFRKKNK